MGQLGVELQPLRMGACVGRGLGGKGELLDPTILLRHVVLTRHPVNRRHRHSQKPHHLRGALASQLPHFHLTEQLLQQKNINSFFEIGRRQAELAGSPL